MALPSLILALLLLSHPCLSWTIQTYMFLISPPRLTTPPGDRYMTRNGTFLSPNYLDSCINRPVPQNITRSKFAVTNGRMIFSITNGSKTAISGGGDRRSPWTETFRMDLGLVHLWHTYLGPPGSPPYNTGVKGTYRHKQTMWRWSSWQNLPDSGKCYIPLNMTTMVVDKDRNALSASDLVGLNVTLGLAVMDTRNYGVFEEVHQCSYVTLVDDAEGQDRQGDSIPHCDSYNPKSPFAPCPTCASNTASKSPSPTSSIAELKATILGWLAYCSILLLFTPWI
ncbi:hypothetical protein CC78DRAFT_361223 [Lojkania enalia]|uniref:Uncharacterized protein n=1 Tax=Lojkania enalia TaxID=147567 RepID=A0A9P4N157_9PLEO|nr:hypothetical protein CC78DRAFT_361223 [Didymosphaeria enalia]